MKIEPAERPQQGDVLLELPPVPDPDPATGVTPPAPEPAVPGPSFPALPSAADLNTVDAGEDPASGVAGNEAPSSLGADPNPMSDLGEPFVGGRGPAPPAAGP